MTETPQNAHARRILEQLLRLREAQALDLRETAPGRGVWKWRFRAGGWPVDVVLDSNVLEMRVYHDRDEVAMSRVPSPVMDRLVARELPPASGDRRPSADEAVAALREVVADWKRGNARIFIRPPAVVGHPDRGNGA